LFSILFPQYNVSMREIESLREEILFFSQKSRASGSPKPPSGLSISRPLYDSEEEIRPIPPRAVTPKAEESELEALDIARFSPLTTELQASSLVGDDFSPVKERFDDEEVPPVFGPEPKPKPRRASDAPSKPYSAKPMAITDVAARFYETIGSSPGSSSSLPHPAPASYYARRQERTRSEAHVSRNRSNSSNASNAPQRPRLSSKMQQRVSRLQVALVPESSDEEVARRAHRQTVLKDILADPGQSPRRASIDSPISTPPPPPPPPPPGMRSGAGVVSHASTAAQMIERERAERRRTQSGGASQPQPQPQQSPAWPVKQADGFPASPPAPEARRPRYLERRDSAASASARIAAEAERARVWIPSAAGMESETS